MEGVDVALNVVDMQALAGRVTRALVDLCITAQVVHATQVQVALVTRGLAETAGDAQGIVLTENQTSAP